MSCWISGLLKGVINRLLWTLSSTRDATMTCTSAWVFQGVLLIDWHKCIPLSEYEEVDSQKLTAVNMNTNPSEPWTSKLRRE